MQDIITILNIVLLQDVFWDFFPVQNFVMLLQTCRNFKDNKKELQELRTKNSIFGDISCVSKRANVKHTSCFCMKKKRQQAMILMYKISRDLIERAVRSNVVMCRAPNGDLQPYSFNFRVKDCAMSVLQIIGGKVEKVSELHARFALCKAFIYCNRMTNDAAIGRALRVFKMPGEVFNELSALVLRDHWKLMKLAYGCIWFCGIPASFHLDIYDVTVKFDWNMEKYLEQDDDWCSYTPIAVAIAHYVLKKRTKDGDDITTRLPTVLPCCMPTYEKTLAFLENME